MDTTCLLVVSESLRVALPVGLAESSAGLRRSLEAVTELLEDALIVHGHRLLEWQQISSSDRQWSGTSHLNAHVTITLYLGADRSISREGVELELSVGPHVLATATILLAFLCEDRSSPCDTGSVN